MITVSSTTATKEELQEAADYGSKDRKAATVMQSEAETAEHPEVDETETGAESETAHTKEDESEPEEPEEEEPEEEEPEDPDQTAQRHMGKTRRKLLRRLSRLSSENLTLQERLEEAERKLAGGEKPPAEVAASQAKPNPKDYKNYEEYVEALADWKIAERDQQRAEAARKEFLKSIFDDYNQQVEHARELHEDFDEAVNSSAAVPVICINAMYELENGAEVAYYLAKHSDVREQLLEWNEPGVRGGVRKMLATLDRISEDLSPKSSSRSNGSAPVKHRPQSAAPAPIRPVGSGASTRSSGPDPSKMPYPDYVRWYQQKYGRR